MKFYAVILGFLVTIPQPNVPRFVVDRVEDNNIAVMEFSINRESETFDIPADEFNYEIKEGIEIPIQSVMGRFYTSLDAYSMSDKNEEVLYQFRSDDNEVWWLLSAEEIGHIPNFEDKYILYFCDNGTTKYNKVCNCNPEWDCECYLYDDIFVCIKRGER